MDGIDGRAEERNEFPACIFIINTPVWAIVGMERERRGSSKIDTTTLVIRKIWHLLPRNGTYLDEMREIYYIPPPFILFLESIDELAVWHVR